MKKATITIMVEPLNQLETELTFSINVSDKVAALLEMKRGEVESSYYNDWYAATKRVLKLASIVSKLQLDTDFLVQTKIKEVKISDLTNS